MFNSVLKLACTVASVFLIALICVIHGVNIFRFVNVAVLLIVFIFLLIVTVMFNGFHFFHIAAKLLFKKTDYDVKELKNVIVGIKLILTRVIPPDSSYSNQGRSESI
jgi:hypothetical protein